MKTKPLTLATLLACAIGPALAAEGGAEQKADSPGAKPFAIHAGNGGFIVNTSVIRLPGKPVKGAPYSAQEVIERQQNLADGNQISNTITSMSYRDAEGRIRDEHRNSKGELSSITITDPVADLVYVLHPRDKTATRMRGAAGGHAFAEAARAAAEAGRASAEAGRAAAEAARARIEQLRKEGKLPGEENYRINGGGNEFIIKRVQRDNGEALPHVQENVRIIAKEMTDERMRELANLGPLLATTGGDFRWAGKATTRELGTKDVAGVKAQGKLRSYEIPAGAVGNTKPIVVSDESWWSPDLQITVYSKHSDPRTGDNIYRLDNLKRDEPAASLFTVPSDYTVKDLTLPKPPMPPVPPAPPAPPAPKTN